jgi:putative DNA primase/helicase
MCVPTTFEKHLATFQRNLYPAMVEDLGTHLGLTAQSLSMLSPGWVPVVRFNKGPNYQGWYVFPERNADGKIIGLSLRNQQDRKAMFPGSRRGLTYAVNPMHKLGQNHNVGEWVRVGEAHVNCPVCLRCDGCLVNADNPDDPDGDAICVRISEGAIRQMELGYLHVRRSRNQGALASNGGPVLILEGATDVAAAFMLGFDAVGRPSNLAGLDMLCDLVRGRDCIIVGENDRKPDGREPGREGAIAAMQMLRRVCKCRLVMPPEHVKDLRAWVSRFDLTKEVFLSYVEQNAESEPPGTVLTSDEPPTVARAFLKDSPPLVRYQGEWLSYQNGSYARKSEDELTATMQQWAVEKKFSRTTQKESQVLPLLPTIQAIREWKQALYAFVLVSDSTVPPAWLNGATGPKPCDLVVFQNGMLDFSSCDRGEPPRWLESTPDLFTITGIPHDHDPTAICPNWQAFLKSSLGDDPVKIDLLQEWFGYCLTPDQRFQVFMYLLGNPGAGKGVVARVFSRLLGGNLNCASTTLGALAGRFGMEPLQGMLAAILPDARLSPRDDGMRGLECLLNISGQDATGVDRKNKSAITASAPTARLMVVSNTLIPLPDHESATARRLKIIHFARNFSANPDTTLSDRLMAEIPGILVWALNGLRRLRRNGAFTAPESSIRAAQDWARATNPAAEFIDDACLIAPNAQIMEEELYDAAVKWNSRKDEWCRSRRQLVRSLRRVCPSLRHSTSPSTGRATYKGLTLTPEAARRLLGRPLTERKAGA